jgi:hypothetical protein
MSCMEEQFLAGGNSSGAIRVGETVRRPCGPWTDSVHGLLRFLEQASFIGSPRVLGFDDHGREVLSYLPGNTVGDQRPWPKWVHSDEALVQVAHWLRSYHETVADFRPPQRAVWREGGEWRPGMIIGHNDAAPYNAVWTDERRLNGFFDWDFAGPVTTEWDLAFTAFAWVPLHARHVVRAEGYTALADRPRRLRRFLDEYRWSGDPAAFLATVRARVRATADGIARTAAQGDAAYQRMLKTGVADSLLAAERELASDMDSFHQQWRSQ